MSRFLQFTGAAACLSGAVLLGFCCWLTVGIRANVAAATAHAVLMEDGLRSDSAETAQAAQALLQKVGVATDQLNATLAALNRPCGTRVDGAIVPCGTLADAAKTLNTARLTLGQVEIAAHHEDQRIGILDQQEALLYADTHAAIAGLPPVELKATATFADLDKLAADRQIAAALANVASMTGSGSQILKDGADEADRLAHPAKKKLTFWGGVWVGLEYVHRLLPPIF